VLVEPFHRAHGPENAHRHRQVEAGPFFADIRGREVDRDRLIRISESGIDQRALDALAALPDRDVRHPDRHEVARRAGLVHVHLDIDQMSIDAIHGGTAGFEQRHECPV
jgi:hypothetical protein